ncbi:MAG: hypothetical protein J2P40_04425 [Candidatus Dormibacteraeota bacterium]|nr:hypothetical protein [Candidatus Dormibacteraeota bacterium]MBO0704242.1 hypothetical protein [Candidatus Dormibacteraeota bacterium]MBO0760502.1 hypothetical protein [Candidatus Dormibacteraeota bacterium]
MKVYSSDEGLRLEQQLLVQMRQLIRDLPEGDPYRAVLERHLGNLEEAVSRLDALEEGQERP